MSHADDLALVTACRDALDPWFPDVASDVIAVAALSLIEDTLNRHHLSPPGFDNGQCWWCIDDNWPCADYRDHRAALHTIATALGINPEPRTDHE